MPAVLDNDIKFLAGVGERRAALLAAELGIRTVGDLLGHYPFRYLDRSTVYRIADIHDDSLVYVQLRVRIDGYGYVGKGPKKRLVVQVSDPSGSAELIWFKGSGWIEKQLERGREYIVFGRPTLFHGQLSVVHPEIEYVGAQTQRTAALQGVYSTTERLTQAQLGTRGLYRLVYNAWQAAESHLTETLPDRIRTEYGLIPLRDALYNIHFPQSQEMLRQAEYRLKFEELFGIQLGILSRRSSRIARRDGFLFPKVGPRFTEFYERRLPFPLTEAQKRVVREIRADTVTGYQMNRLLQGDVGSGKTLVALLCMLLAADNGFQACLMAPTELLARQHYATLSRLLDGSGVRVEVLTGTTPKKERTPLAVALEAGDIDLLIGTHALLEDAVRFANLGLVVIDEQHRFGVEQRARMWTKNDTPPHVLVMTATPIPRTLAMTLYGDLDVSVIDELPPGRKPVRTVHRYDSDRLAVFGFLRRQIALGRQAYIVYPLIKESEKMDYKNLYEGYDSIVREFPGPQYVTAVVHGQMPAENKSENMRLFVEGRAQILVATSVIEVGVDVPNASVMVIESAERFGLSQLHQLRGRVGRGAEQSYCILLSGQKLSREARARLQAMVRTGDGFKLAELDMRLRGAGDIAGTQQSGMAFDLKIANLSRDNHLVELTRNAALAVLDDDPALERPENAPLRGLRERYSLRQTTDFSMIS